MPLTYYKETAYRARAVIDPRGVLREIGLDSVRVVAAQLSSQAPGGECPMDFLC
ncbi:MAG: nitrile hydratase subunit alpha [Woeseiaceae bacterium]|nr:nitrile hydratase subunit alpha [Woeseiaceae bacterium]